MKVEGGRRTNGVSVEYLLASSMVCGILLFNRAFAHVNFRQIYLTEFLLALGLLATAGAAFARHDCLASVKWSNHAPELLWAGLGLATLALSWTLGLLAVRQSLIVLYVALVPLFVTAFDSPARLKHFLRTCLLVFSAIIPAKLVAFLLLGRRHANEPYRVAHDGVDAVFSSLALIGLFVFRRRFAQRPWLFGSLAVANALVLALTMKRSAYLGLLVAGVVLMVSDRGSRRNRDALLKGALAVALIGLTVATVVVIAGEPALGVVAKKLDIQHDNNASWRLAAWSVAYARFRANPILGAGYGKPILATAIGGVDTMDPHNSFLALMVYNGILGLAALLWLLAHTTRSYLSTLRDTTDDELKRLTLFLMGGLAFMVVYAFFNVALEIQRFSIFFWLFVACAHVVRRPPRLAATAAEAAHPWPWLHRGVPALALLVYLGAVFHPSNRPQELPIYSPRHGGQLPVLLEPSATGQQMVAAPDGLTLSLDGNDHRQCLLSWTIHEMFDPIAGQEADYALRATFREPCTRDVRLHLFTLSGDRVDLPRSRILGNTVTVALDALHGVALDQLEGLVMVIPHGREPSSLTLECLKLVRESASAPSAVHSSRHELAVGYAR
jgi:O-antigen ligase